MTAYTALAYRANIVSHGKNQSLKNASLLSNLTANLVHNECFCRVVLLCLLKCTPKSLFTFCPWYITQSINQSKFIFWAIEILQCIQCMLALKRLPEKHTLIKLAAQTTKEHKTNRKAEKTGGDKQWHVQCKYKWKHSLNKSTLYVQSGLKYNNLCGKCPEKIHYITSGHKTTTILVFFR